MSKKAVHAGKPVAGAPYSPGIVTGNFVYVSGQLPINPESGALLRDDFEAEVELCIHNLERVLKAAGTDLEHCVKIVIFLQDLNNFSRLNTVYGRFFGDIKPARSCVQVARLPLDANVEIEAVAELP